MLKSGGSHQCVKLNFLHIRANKSIVGTWDIVKYESSWGERLENGININGSFEIDDADDLGSFVFDDETVTYSILNSDTTGNAINWSVERTKENQGFTQVEVYTIQIGQKEYDCSFGDETSDAEKNATEMVLFNETKIIGDYNNFTFHLEKR